MFRLIVTDMDGTLVGASLVIPQRNLNALTLAMESGCRVTIATGRQFGPTAQVARNLGVNAPLILCQGALIQDYGTETIIHKQTIPLDIARQVIRYAGGLKLAVQIHFETDEAYTDIDNPYVSRMETITGASIQTVPNLEQWLDRPPLKILFYQRAPQLPALLAQLEEKFGDRLQIVRSWRHLIEITDGGVSKAEALAHLAARLGIDQSETMAVGDQDNDASMLRWAGLGVAMNAASTSAKAAADVIAPPWPGKTAPDCHDEGVAWAVERYVLGWQ